MHFSRPCSVSLTCIDFERFDPSRLGRAAARSRLGVHDDAPVLGMISQITPWKGHDDALRAFASVVRAYPSSRLLLVGSAKFLDDGARFDHSAYLGELESLVRAMGLRDRVAMLGERADIPQLLRALDVLLVPSWEEPFGRVIIEAMAMRTPVIATSLGGPPEILRDGVDGVLLPPRAPQAWARAIEELLGDPGRRRRMALGGRERAEQQFGIERHASQVVALYEEALSMASVVAA